MFTILPYSIVVFIIDSNQQLRCLLSVLVVLYGLYLESFLSIARLVLNGNSRLPLYAAIKYKHLSTTQDTPTPSKALPIACHGGNRRVAPCA